MLVGRRGVAAVRLVAAVARDARGRRRHLRDDRGLRPADPQERAPAPARVRRRHAAPDRDPRGDQGDQGVPRRGRTSRTASRARRAALFRRGMRVAVNRTLARTLVDALNNIAAVGVLVRRHLPRAARAAGASRSATSPRSRAITVTLYRPVRDARARLGARDGRRAVGRALLRGARQPDRDPRRGRRRARCRGIRDGVRFENVTLHLRARARARATSASRRARARWSRSSAAPARARRRSSTCCCASTTRPAGAIAIDGVDLRDVAPRPRCSTRWRSSRRSRSCSTARSARTSATAGSTRATTRSSPPRAPPTSTSSPRRCPTATTPRSATAGTRLSGGQRQRVTIARAILRDPGDPRARRGHQLARLEERAPRAGRDRRSCCRAAPCS